MSHFAQKSSLWQLDSGHGKGRKGRIDGGKCDLSGCSVGSFATNFGSDNLGGGENGLLSGNEKDTMRKLNDRLTVYLDKVGALEQANSTLEYKIKAWYKKLGPGSNGQGEKQDYKKYYQIIEELKNKISDATTNTTSFMLQSDNVKLAAEDFRQKYETKLALCQSIEADISGLRQVPGDLTLSNTDLEMQIETLTEELAYLKKNHEDEINSLPAVAGSEGRAEMHGAPGADLPKLLNDVRTHYEAVTQQNHQDAEIRFNNKSRVLLQKIAAAADASDSAKIEMDELKWSFQALERELQSTEAQKTSLEAKLTESEANSKTQLSLAQIQISTLETQVLQVRSETESQRAGYERLLNLKTHLENEIKTYHRLLEGRANASSIPPPVVTSGHEFETGSKRGNKIKEPTKIFRYKTIVEELVDGTVVSSQIKDIHQRPG